MGAFLLFLAITLPVTLYLSQQRQSTQSQAGATTSLYLTPATTTSSPVSKTVGQTVSFDVMVNPGNNLPSVIKLEITYDPTKLQANGASSFVANSTAFPQVIEGPLVLNGSILATLSIGSDTTKAIATTTKVGTVTFTTKEATTTPTEIAISNRTQILSVATADQATENVLSTKNPAFVTIADSTITPTPLPATATINATPTNGTLVINNPTTVAVAVNGGGQAFNAAQATVAVSNNLTVTNLTNGNCNFTYTQTPTAATPTFAGAILGSSSNSCTVYTLTVRPNAGGTGTITFSGGSVKAYTNNAEILSGVQNGSYTITAPSSTPIATMTVQPTATPVLTLVPTVPTSGTRLSLTLFLHGIGNSGDNANPDNYNLSNKDPRHPVRNVTVELYNTANALAGSGIGTVSYNEATGNFTGVITLPDTIAQGQYLVKVKSPLHLKKLIPGIQTITVDANQTMAPITLVAGDTNNDNRLNIIDYNSIIGCYSDLQAAVACTDELKIQTDLNDDSAVNQIDYNLFLREITVQNGD